MEPSPAGMEGYLKYPSMPLIHPLAFADLAQAISLLLHAAAVRSENSRRSLSTSSTSPYTRILRGSGASSITTLVDLRDGTGTTRTRR